MSRQKIGYIIARQRSGTHAIRSILENNYKIRALGEIFHPKQLTLNNVQFQTFFYRRIIEDPSNILDASKVYEKYLSFIEKKFSDKNLIFLDIKYNSINYIQEGWTKPDLISTPYLIRKIRNDNNPVIHITRFNYLKQYLSKKIARANELFATKKKIDLKTASIKINIEDMLNSFNEYSLEDKLIKIFFENHKNYITFDYDEIFFGTNSKKYQILGKINNIVGDTNNFKFESKFKKINNKMINEAVENFEDVKKSLGNTEYSYCLDEVLNDEALKKIREQ